MRTLDIDVSGLEKLSKITDEEAAKLLEKGKSIIYRAKMREFLEIKHKPELEQARRLYEIQVYDRWELYVR